jgi:hypothetical protein
VKENAMKVTVLRGKSRKVQTVAMLNPVPTGRIHVELQGGGAVRELDVDPAVIDPQALMGRRGREAQEAAHEKLRRMI